MLMIIDGSGTSAKFTVKYTGPLGGMTKRGIGYDQLMALPFFYSATSHSQPKRAVTVQKEDSTSNTTKNNNNNQDDTIVELFSYKNLSKEIDYLCSSSGIHRWMASHEGYPLYTQHILPLLSLTQMKKHVRFAKHLLNNWGLPQQKNSMDSLQ